MNPRRKTTTRKRQAVPGLRARAAMASEILLSLPPTLVASALRTPARVSAFHSALAAIVERAAYLETIR